MTNYIYSIFGHDIYIYSVVSILFKPRIKIKLQQLWKETTSAKITHPFFLLRMVCLIVLSNLRASNKNLTFCVR